MLVSPLASSTASPMIFIGQEPSSRWFAAHHSYAASAAATSPPTSSAIAPSTWFQTSMCSPTAHGTPPSSCWTAAIAAAVSTTWAAWSSPGTSGMSHVLSVMRSAVRVRLLEVEDEALPDQRVQRLLRQPGGQRPLHDVPHEHLVHRLYE